MTRSLVEEITTASPAPIASFRPSQRPEVSIVIVAFGGGPVLLRTLESIAAAQRDDGPETEIIVVSNPHPSLEQRSLVELQLASSGVRAICPAKNLGFGGGCELGVLHARGQLLAFVNPDVEVTKGWLMPLIEAARDPHQGPTIAAPVLLNPDGTVQEAGQRLLRTGWAAPVTRIPSTVQEVDYASAACWVVSKADHERLGGFDPAYHPAYFEDVDLALRARSLGGRCVVVPSVCIVHHLGQGSPDSAPSSAEQREVALARWPEIRWRAERAGGFRPQ